jgi:hypothetical protein
MTEAIDEADPRIAIPSTVYAEYWPTTILLPASLIPGGETRRRVRVYLTDTGLHVFYTRPPDERRPHLSAPIDFERTPAPDIHARNIGVDVYVLAGGDPLPDPIVLTPVGGCGCGASLRFWRPTWAHDTSPWPAS